MQDKNKTKSKIVDAMYNLIVTEGYEKASIGKICDSIGITKAAAYYYFKSKEDIFLEIVKQSYEIDFTNLFTKLQQTKSKDEYIDMVIYIGHSLVDVYKNDPSYRKVCYEIDIQTYRIPKAKEIVSDYIQKENGYFIEILKKGATLNLIDESTIQSKAQYLQTVITGIDKAILFDYPIDAKEVWTYTVKQLIKEN